MRDHLHDLVEPEEYKPKVKEEDRDEVQKSPDTRAFEANLKKINKEEEEKEEFIDKRKEWLDSFPKNPAVE